MRTRQTMTVSLPPAMIEAVDKLRKAEHRTRSELVREALRTYFSVAPTYRATAHELQAIEKGRAALRRGEYATLNELRASLGGPGRKGRTQKRAARPPPVTRNASSGRSRRCGGIL